MLVNRGVKEGVNTVPSVYDYVQPSLEINWWSRWGMSERCYLNVAKCLPAATAVNFGWADTHETTASAQDNFISHHTRDSSSDDCIYTILRRVNQ